jgi:hypothetical protein
MEVKDNKFFPDECPFYFGEGTFDQTTCEDCFGSTWLGEYHNCSEYMVRCGYEGEDGDKRQ